MVVVEEEEEDDGEVEEGEGEGDDDEGGDEGDDAWRLASTLFAGKRRAPRLFVATDYYLKTFLSRAFFYFFSANKRLSQKNDVFLFMFEVAALQFKDQ